MLPHPRPALDRLFLPALGLFLVFAWRCQSLGLVVDDAFISFRHAFNWVEHGELVYNLGERVEGFTSPLFTLLIAVGLSLGASAPGTGQLLGFLAAVAALILVYHASTAKLNCSPLAAGAACSVLALNTSFCFWAVSGLESSLFAVAFVVAWYALPKPDERSSRSAFQFLVATVILGLIRTEGLLVPLAAPWVLRWRGLRGPVFWKGIGFTWGSLVAVECARLVYYGSAWPTPTQAKFGLSTAALFRGAQYLINAVEQDGLAIALPLAIAGSWRRPEARLLAIPVALYLGLILALGGDGLYRYRLVAHLFPALCILLAVGLDHCRALSRGIWRVSLGLLGISTLLPLLSPSFFRNHSIEAVRDWEDRWGQVGRSLQRAVPPDALLATNVAGRVPFYSRLRTIDLLGLTDPTIASTPNPAFGQGYAGHERASPSYIRQRAPDIIYFSVLDGLPEQAFTDPKFLGKALGSGSLRAYAPLIDGRGFTQEWRPARLLLEDGTAANLLLRDIAGSAAHRAWARQDTARLRVLAWAPTTP